MTYEKIVTLYDTLGHAETARRNLESAGFLTSDVSMITSKSLSLAGDKLREPGLWHRLFGRDIQQYEATLYGRTIDSGGAVLTVRVPEADVARATSILNAPQAVDVLKRAEQEGLITTAAAERPAPAVARAAGSTLPGEEVFALAEEEINVGKRMIQQGATRIRRFVTETPVEAQVSLHEEHAKVIRRAIADPNYVRNIDWTDKTIEITETIEEPVVTKSAHVAEEVVVQREGVDRVTTVRDKVRRQKVEVERVNTESNIRK
jgi:stress response protein YsnF